MAKQGGSTSSLSENEKEKDFGLVDPQTAVENPTEYEPIRTEPKEKDLDNGDSHSTRGNLSRLQSSTSAYSEGSDLESDATSSIGKKKKKRQWNLLKRNPPPVPKTRVVSPEYNANFFSRLTWQWMQPLMRVGYKRPLERNDIWSVNPDRSADVMAAKLEAAFQRRRAAGKQRPLLGAMFDTFKWEFIIGGLCQLSASVIQSVAPFVLRYLINFAVRAYAAQHTPNVTAPNIGEGIGLVIGITALQFLQSLATNHFMYRGMMIGGEARGVLIALIFSKAMKLSGRAKAGGKAILEAPPSDIKPGSEAEVKWYKKVLGKKRKDKKASGTAGVAGDGEGWGNGRIVNLMSTDTYRVDQASGFFHMIWTAPVGILVTTALLLVNLTYSALPGLGLILIAMPLLGRAVKTLFRRRVAINKITDQRVSLTQEILQGVRFVKYFGWETSFLERIQNIRKREIGRIQVLLTIRNAVLAVGMSMPVFASMISFITYSQVNSNLDPAPIFSSLALFNSMRIPLNFLPLVIGQVIDANASVGRIQEFLLAEEAEESGTWDYNAKDAVVLKGADFTWERHPTQDAEDSSAKGGKKPETKQEKKDKKADLKQEKKDKKASAQLARGDGVTTPSDTTIVEEEKPFEIKGLDLTFGRNELTAVIGSVGSGKSSLLAALAGDMRKTSGEVVFGASRAFCPQYAWIQNATVRENIVFGKDFKKKWYDEVVDACALRPDLDMLPHGDATEIGERGITVSGGQKQRMNIARAIYFDADIILMDDPLSAVDAHVGRHIMDNAICGLLKDKCRILATHQLHVLSRCDRIIWIEEGGVQAVDTFDNLMNNNKDFVQLMSTTAKEEEKEEEEEDDDEVGEAVVQVKSTKKERKQKKQAALMQTEERATKSVSWSVWMEYIRAGGGIWVGPLVFILLVLSQGANIVTSLWLSYWTSNKFGYSEGAYIAAYASFGFSQALFMFLFSWAVSVFGTEAGKTMLHRAITRVLRAPMSFFDTTPLGRITNRFSKDIDVMDNTLTDAIRMYFLTLAMIISVFILIISYYYYYAIALGPLFLFFMFSAAFYRSSAREVKRHEAVLRSTVFARFGEAVMGTPTIRAYGLQDQFSKSVRSAVDDMNSAYYLTFANQRWLSVRLDIVGILLVFTTGILVVTSRFSVNPSIAGLVLSYILTIVQMIQFTVRQLAEVENNMNSTERIHHYGTQLEEEAALHASEVRPTWPEHGEIVFDNVEMRYRNGLPLVLKGLSMHVRAGERIGVVGRTGAGKSSIMSTLFRLQELSGGSIMIDGVDIAKIGLHDLRSKLAIIPQDPTLFKGTIRSNLDPFHEHSDLELWSSLRQADLVSNEQTMDDHSSRIHLDSVVEEEGLNFSLGQRQLMALARALVRGSQIIVCDEATSSVDFETDAKIQRTIVEGFRGKTLLCIAHRLKTIINYDRICVMDAGQIAELDTPLNLYDQGGIFKGMCERSGIRRQDFFGEH